MPIMNGVGGDLVKFIRSFTANDDIDAKDVNTKTPTNCNKFFGHWQFACYVNSNTCFHFHLCREDRRWCLRIASKCQWLYFLKLLSCQLTSKFLHTLLNVVYWIWFWFQLGLRFTTENVVKCVFSIDAGCFNKKTESEFLDIGKSIFAPSFLVGLKFLAMPILPQWAMELIPVP